MMMLNHYVIYKKKERKAQCNSTNDILYNCSFYIVGQI